MDIDPAIPWFHGSPQELTSLQAGSTITQRIELARIFSHKPSIVSIFDDGRIRHNGTRPGFLYVVAEEVTPEDIAPHPQTTMAPGDEWLTNRDLRVRLLDPVEILPGEQLSAADLAALQQKIDARRGQEA